MARRAADFGVELEAHVSVDMKRVKARKDDIVRPSTEGVEQWLEGTPNVTVYRGHGRFEGATTVRVNEQLLEADKISLNVGTRALTPEMPGLEEMDYLTNSSMMEVDFPARASDHHRRQLHRPGVCPDLPPFRQPGDGG